MFFKNKSTIYQLFIILISALLFIPFLGNVHLFDWDEINFAESARDMILTKNYITVCVDFKPFWEKPPLFAWMQVLSMKTFGINEFAARFPNAITGIFTLLIVFNIGKKLYNEKFGLIWALVYAGSILPHLYFKSGIIDPLFNLFIFLGIYYFILFAAEAEKQKLKYIFFSALFIGLGIMTKGPVAFVLFFLSGIIFMIFNKLYKKFLNFKVILIYAFTVALVGGFWFILQALTGNLDILKKFIEYQIRLFTEEDAGHGGFLLYHFVVLFIGVFPASVFVLKSFRKYKDSSILQTYFRQWMIVLFWTVLILFTIVNTKIVHYSSMCYFPMSFLAAYIINKIFCEEQKFDKWMKVIVATLAFIIGILVISLQFIDKYKDKIINSGIIKDEFAVGNLSANVNWTGFEFFVGLVLIVGVLASILIIKDVKKQLVAIFISTMIFTNICLLVIAPRIEQYSQNAAISFYKKISKEDCYLEAFGFKSYAIYYYFNKQKPLNEKAYDMEWLLNGNVDKPVYFVCKNFHEEEFSKTYVEFKKVESKNGFVFFKREIRK
jgi:4-amino-4-deoxy-L-arabinose transferase-like glycosyltransferase